MATMDNGHALVVGIADYQYINKLPPVKDAQDVAGLLRDPGRCAYAPENVRLLLDGEATLAGVREALAGIAAHTDEESTVFIYWSGHGGRVATGPYADQYLLPVDTVYRSDESLAQTAVSGAEFTAALQAIAAQKVVVVFDCCHAGGIGRPRDAATPALDPGPTEAFYDALKAGRGRVIFASSRSTEYSYVLPQAEYGLFTQHLLDGLRGGVPSDDGYIRVFELFEYVQPRVTADHPSQHPVFRADIEENFPVALYLSGRRGLLPRDEDGFRYDAYVSYADAEPDAGWVWGTLVPRLEAAGLRVAVSGDVEQPGVARVVNIERGIRQAKRTVLVMSDRYLADHMADFENVLGQTMGIQEGTYRLLPVALEPIDPSAVPARLSALTTLQLGHPQRGEREFTRLIDALKGPLPRHSPPAAW